MSDVRICRHEGCDRPASGKYSECSPCRGIRRGVDMSCAHCRTTFRATYYQIKSAEKAGRAGIICCSRECRTELKRSQKPAIARVCCVEGCDNVPTASGARECSRCSSHRRGADAVCAACEKPFRATGNQIREAKRKGRAELYCSRPCIGVGMRRANELRVCRHEGCTRLASPKRGTECVACREARTGADAVCAYEKCKRPFRARGRQIWAARKAGRTTLYCSPLCASLTREVPDDLRVQRKNLTFDKAAIAARDGGWDCCICDLPMLPKARYHRDPMMASYEHIVPAGLGGEDSWENTMLSHLKCNVVRRRRPLEVARADATLRRALGIQGEWLSGWDTARSATA